MTDIDYWKKLYQGLWATTGKREEAIAQTIEKLTGRKVNIIGMGAGSDQFLSGNAISHGYKKGDPDMTVEGTNICLEVTGPNINVPYTVPLWIRPDKIENAKGHFPAKDTWIIHCIENHTIRTIKLDASFFAKYDSGQFEIVHPLIRHVTETYIAIPYNDLCVLTFDVLIEHIKNWKK